MGNLSTWCVRASSELADIWTPEISAESYAAFLWRLTQRLTKLRVLVYAPNQVGSAPAPPSGLQSRRWLQTVPGVGHSEHGVAGGMSGGCAAQSQSTVLGASRDSARRPSAAGVGSSRPTEPRQQRFVLTRSTAA